jgi:hypothetical protein
MAQVLAWEVAASLAVRGEFALNFLRFKGLIHSIRIGAFIENRSFPLQRVTFENR